MQVLKRLSAKTPNRESRLKTPLKTVLFRDDGVSHVLKSSCIGPYTAIFRAWLPCPHTKILVFRGALRKMFREIS